MTSSFHMLYRHLNGGSNPDTLWLTSLPRRLYAYPFRLSDNLGYRSNIGTFVPVSTDAARQQASQACSFTKHKELTSSAMLHSWNTQGKSASASLLRKEFYILGLRYAGRAPSPLPESGIAALHPI